MLPSAARALKTIYTNDINDIRGTAGNATHDVIRSLTWRTPEAILCT